MSQLSVGQGGWGIATNPVASLVKSSADVGHGSAAMCFEVGRLLCTGQL